MNSKKQTRQEETSSPCQPLSAAEMVDEIQSWIADVTEWGVPHFGEFGYRLRCYRDTLAAEFADDGATHQVQGASEIEIECEQEMR